MVDPRLRSVLKRITRQFAEAGVQWALVGSLSLALQGVEIEPQDIDILTNREGAFMIDSMLRDRVEKKVEYSETNSQASYFGIFKLDGVELDIMGDYRERSGDGWVDPFAGSGNPKTVEVDGLRIPVASLEEQLISYRRLGRPKDLDKTQRILRKLRSVGERSMT